MNIDRSNYEVWFIDWLDGNINSSQTKELYRFLDLNPDLKGEFNDLANTLFLSSENPYPFKDELKRSIEEISESQFEFLSAAYLENDLSDLQKSEVDEIISKDPVKKKTFELINKTHLTPLNFKYKNKKRLLKSTPAHKIIRMSVIGLSSVAAIALIIATYISAPRNITKVNNNEASAIKPDSTSMRPFPEKIIDNIQSSNNKQNEVLKKRDIKSILNQNDQTQILIAGRDENTKEYSAERNSTEPGVEKIKIPELSRLSQSTGTYDLASSYIYVPDEEPDNERSKIGKYIAKTFREKFLKEKTPPDSPLKAYEIAEAGVTGINKIFGWEMALDKKNDENGNLKSVYFSSRIIKFNAPVKKSEPLP